MTKLAHRILDFVLRHSFVARHSCFAIFLTISVGSALAEKRPITEKDLWDFVWIGDPQISPDGTRVVFVRVTVNDKKEGYNTSLWLAATDGSQPPRQLTTGEHDGQPRWSSDGQSIAFVRANVKDDKPE